MELLAPIKLGLQYKGEIARYLTMYIKNSRNSNQRSLLSGILAARLLMALFWD
jgi:hypothetical protein